MSFIESIVAHLPTVDSRSVRDVDEEIRDEIEFHLAMRKEENVRAGMSPAAAEAAAQERFGDVRRIRNECRKAQLGERIMLQRVQTAMIAALFIAVLVIGYQSYSAQRANQSALADVAKQLRMISSNDAEAGVLASTSPVAVPEWAADRPRVVTTFPKQSAADVDPAIDEIRVTFDKPMADGCWSWVKSSAESFPESTGEVHYLPDMKTCVMPVKLKPGTRYVVWFNSANYQKFKDRDGRPAVPFLLTFTTASD